MIQPEKEEIRLQEALKRLKMPCISQNDQTVLRNKILHTILQKEILPSQYELLKEAIKRIAKATLPQETFQTRLLHKLLAIIGGKPTKFFRFWIFLESRKALTFATLLIFSAVTFFSFFGASPKALAAPISFFENVHGEVQVVRRGETFRAIRDFRLRQNDVIRTNANASATIHFLDDSVSRLAENSSVKIDRLFADPRDYTDTAVSISLIKGRLYASILNLVNNGSQFEVKAKNVTALAHKKSAFDVSMAEEGKTKVAAIQHSVDVKVLEKKQPIVETTLTNGFSIEVSNGKSKVKKPSQKEVKDEWISLNLHEDETYIENLKEEYRSKREDEAGKASLITFSDVDREVAKLQAASAKLIQAETLFQIGRAENAQVLLSEFESLVVAVKIQRDEWKLSDPAKAQKIHDALTNVMNDYRKQFALYLPSDVLYPLKERIANIDVSLTNDSVEKREKQMAQAGDKLIEAATLQTQGNQELAVMQVQAYSVQVSEVVQEIKELPEEEKQEASGVLLDQKADHLKLLGAIAETAKLSPPPVLKPGETRGISLNEILVQATKDSLHIENAIASDVSVLNGVKVNGESVVSSILPQSAAILAVDTANNQAEEISPLQQITPDNSFSGVTVIQIEATFAPQKILDSAKSVSLPK